MARGDRAALRRTITRRCRPTKPRYSRESSNCDQSTEHLVIAIQRRWRAVRVAFAEIGPSFFRSHGGRAALYGSLNFRSAVSQRLGVEEIPSPFIAISPDTGASRFSLFIERHWKLRRPEIILTIRGSSANLKLGYSDFAALTACLASVCRTAEAWIFTGGLDSGVAQLVGDSLAQEGIAAPLIGIAPFGAVRGYARLKKSNGATIRYRETAKDSEAVPLNTRHSHFVLVDDGKRRADAWSGAEIDFRTELERHYSQEKRVPVVALCVQGGIGTLKAIARSPRTPTVLLTDTGGACAALHKHCCRRGDLGDTGDLGETGNSFQAHLALLKEAAASELSSDTKRLTFYSVAKGGGARSDSGDHLATVVLGALCHMRGGALDSGTASDETAAERQQASTARGERSGAPPSRGLYARKLTRLTIKWDRLDLLEIMLRRIGQEGLSGGGSYEVSVALQLALELGRDRLAMRLLRQPGCSCRDIDMCPLYLDLVSRYEYSHERALLRRQLADYASSRQSRFLIYQQTVGGYLNRLTGTNVAGDLLRRNPQGPVQPHDGFMWAVGMGKDDLAEAFLQRTQ